MFGSPETTPGRPRAEVLLVGPPGRPQDREPQGRHRGRGLAHAREGREEQGGAAVPSVRVRHHVRQGHLQGGLAHRRRASTWRSSRRPAPGSPTRASSSARAARTRAQFLAEHVEHARRDRAQDPRGRGPDELRRRGRRDAHRDRARPGRGGRSRTRQAEAAKAEGRRKADAVKSGVRSSRPSPATSARSGSWRCGRAAARSSRRGCARRGSRRTRSRTSWRARARGPRSTTRLRPAGGRASVRRRGARAAGAVTGALAAQGVAPALVAQASTAARPATTRKPGPGSWPRSRASRMGAWSRRRRFGRLTSFLMRRGYAPEIWPAARPVAPWRCAADGRLGRSASCLKGPGGRSIPTTRGILPTPRSTSRQATVTEPIIDADHHERRELCATMSSRTLDPAAASSRRTHGPVGVLSCNVVECWEERWSP